LRYGCSYYEQNQTMNESTILKFLRGHLSGDEIRQFREWVQQCEANKKYFVEIKNIWTTLHLDQKDSDYTIEDEFKRITAHINLHQSISQRKNIDIPSTHNNRLNKKILIPIAASIILIFSLLGTIFIHKNNTSSSYNEITTQRGEKSLVTLADGTRIWLNSQTSLRYPSNISRKKIKVILDGEAFFDVAKQKGRTFIVQASTLEIAALGTSFNVKSYSDDGLIETTLEEGKISITGKIGSKQLKQPVLLKPNMQATFITNSQEYHIRHTNKEEQLKEKEYPPIIEEIPSAVSEKLILTEEIDTKLYSSWKDGKLIFKSERFEDLAVRMERWYDVQIFIKEQELRNKKYTGIFEKETIEQALKALSLSMPFYYTIDQNLITIKKTEP